MRKQSDIGRMNIFSSRYCGSRNAHEQGCKQISAQHFREISFLNIWNISGMFYFSSCNMGPTLYLLCLYFCSVYTDGWSLWLLVVVQSEVWQHCMQLPSKECGIISIAPSPPSPQVITHRCDALPRGCWLVWLDISVLLPLVWSVDWSTINFGYKQVRSGRNGMKACYSLLSCPLYDIL